MTTRLTLTCAMSALLVSAAACSQSATTVAPLTAQSARSVMSSEIAPSAPKTYLYASTIDWTGAPGSVYVYDAYSKSSQPLKTMQLQAGFSEGLWTDSHANVYVAVVNAGPTGLGYIAKYTPGLGKLLETYTAGLSGPVGGTFDKSGNMYVADICSPNAVSCGVFARTHQPGTLNNGYIGFYPPGSMSPTKKIQGAALTAPVGLALDKEGDIFAANNTGGQAWSVVELEHGTYQSHTVQFKNVPSNRWVGAVAFNSDDVLLASINTAIDFFPKKHGAWSKQLTNGVLVADGLAFGPDGTLFAGNFEFENNEGNVVAFPPGATKPARSYAVPYNQGVVATAVGSGS